VQVEGWHNLHCNL